VASFRNLLHGERQCGRSPSGHVGQQKQWRKQKHQYFGHLSGKKLIKVNKNLEEQSGTLRLHSATRSIKND